MKMKLLGGCRGGGKTSFQILGLQAPHPLQDIIDLCREIEEESKMKMRVKIYGLEGRGRVTAYNVGSCPKCHSTRNSPWALGSPDRVCEDCGARFYVKILTEEAPKMKNCKTCGQPLPKRTPQPKDMVEISPLVSTGVQPRMGIVLDVDTNNLMNQRYGPPMSGNIRVTVLNGSLKGMILQFQASRLTVVQGTFRVTERL